MLQSELRVVSVLYALCGLIWHTGIKGSSWQVLILKSMRHIHVAFFAICPISSPLLKALRPNMSQKFNKKRISCKEMLHV